MTDIGTMISQLERQRSAIDRAISALRDVDAGKLQTASAARVASRPVKNRLSEEGRRRIAEATRKRWALRRAAQASQSGAATASAKKAHSKRAARAN